MNPTPAKLNRREFVTTGAMALSALAAPRAWSAQTATPATSRQSLFDGRTLDGWIQAENNAASLSASSIPNPAAFATRLVQKQDPVAALLWDKLDSLVKADLTTYAASNANAAPLLSATVKEINAVLAGPSIFTADRFHGITLRPETFALLNQNPQGAAIGRLNKLLLEDAFPTEITRSPATGWIVNDGVIASTGSGRGVLYTAQDYSRYRLLYNVRHVSGHPDHQAGVLFFCQRPQPNQPPLDALGGIQFQVPMGSHWDYRPANNNSGDSFFTTIVKPTFDRHAWSQVEVLVDATKGTARLAVAQPPGSKAIELVTFNDPTAGRTGPIAFQMHNGDLFDEYKDITIEPNPQTDTLITTTQTTST